MARKKVAGPTRYFPKNVWKKKEIENHILIIGNDDLCISLVNLLAENKKPVTVLNPDTSLFSNFPENKFVRIITDNPANNAVLSDSLYPSSKVLAVSDNDAVNIITALLARKKHGIENVYIKVSDPELNIIYADQGISELSSEKAEEVFEILFPAVNEEK